MVQGKHSISYNCRGYYRARDELSGAVVAAADVRDVGLAPHQVLGRAEVAQLQDAGLRVQQQVLRLDVSVADALRFEKKKETLLILQ